MDIKNKLVRFYLLGVLLVSSSEDFKTALGNRRRENIKGNHIDDYIKEKSYFYLGDDISDETIRYIIEWINSDLYSGKTPLYILNKIGNDEILKFNDNPYIINGKIIGFHKVLSKRVINEFKIDGFLENIKYKFRELRLHIIKNKSNEINK